MDKCNVTFETANGIVSTTVNYGTPLTETARQAGVEISLPCGDQGRCGRCIVHVLKGKVHQRSTLRLSPKDIAEGYTLACQTTVEGDLYVLIPPQKKIERRLTTARTVAEIPVPSNYDPNKQQTTRRIGLSLPPPSLDDQTDDWSRLQTAIRAQAGISPLSISLDLLQKIGTIMRSGEWNVTAVVDVSPDQESNPQPARLVALYPGNIEEKVPLWGAAIDIGTTTVTIWLVDLLRGKVEAQVAEYNGQIARGEDVISRIVYANKNGGGGELQKLVNTTINNLIASACRQLKIRPDDIHKVTVAGNPTMIHLFLGIPAQSIRLSPYITGVNQIPTLAAKTVGLCINPDAGVDCLPGVASYVGSDITAGVLSSKMTESEQNILFIDVGTNGEIVLGNRDWLITCACSAGPAFEGAGVVHGMRATRGAIEEVWISGAASVSPYEPTYRVIGGIRPTGICGSGLISLLAEMFLTGLVDKTGNIDLTLNTPRVRQGGHGPEYVVAWGKETGSGKDIVITGVDIDNLKRAKAAIYAGFQVLAASVGIELETVDKVLVAGAFGKHINVEKAIQIGLLPDIPWERIQYLGNTSARGAYYALLDWQAREKVKQIASRMTYLELSVDNSFYEAFMSAMFLPHTQLDKFPNVIAAIEKRQEV